MYRFVLRHLAFRDPSKGNVILVRNLHENLISTHRRKFQHLDQSHCREYFSSPEKWQFFEEKPLHPSLLSDVSSESDITIEKGNDSV